MPRSRLAATLASLLPALLLGSLAMPAQAEPAPAADNAVTIDLLGFTDLHGHLSRTTDIDRNTGQTRVVDPGAVTLACEVAAARADNPHTLLVSAGDSIGGSAYVSSILQDRPTLEALNAMGVDATALGNHELDQGLADLEDRVLPTLDAPVLAANLTGSSALDAEGSRGAIIKEINGVRVALVGVVTDELPTLVSPSAISTLELSPAIERANTRATELKDGQEANGEADVVVVLSHEDAATTAPQFNRHVDAVFAGHTHVPFARSMTGAEGNQIAVVQADHYGWALGRISLRHDPATGSTTVVTADNIDLRSSACTADAYGVAGIVSRAEADSAAEGSRPLARIGSDFLRGSDGGGPGSHRGTESTASNLIAESFRHWLATDIQPDGAHYLGIMNAGGVRADYTYASSEAGEGDGVLTAGEAYTVQPFGNEMAYTTMTGAELKALLAQQWQPGASRSVLTLGLSSNASVLLDVGAQAELAAIQADLAATGAGADTRAADIEAARSRVVRQIVIDGQALADTDTVVVASNSFLLEGGDGYTALSGRPYTNTGTLDRDVTSAYLASFGDQAVTASYDKRQTGLSVSAGDDGALTVTLDGLAYTNGAEQAAGARSLRVMSRGAQILSQDIDLQVDPSGPTTGRAELSLTMPADAEIGPCRTLSAAQCRWVSVESLDAAGTVLNSFLIEAEADAAPTGAPTAEPSTAPTAQATSAPAPTAGAGVGTAAGAAAGQAAGEAVTATPSARTQPSPGPSGRPGLASTGAAPVLPLGAGLVLLLGGALLLHRRLRQTDRA
ncbi:5'-nucleotidase C-terminal domain-containing protein [Actinomyces slackii]|uniref:Endonuclease YhcR n=1 Tax=Actinomyces slackii TaxID=52774 RepID=A0A3S4TBR7_9ACTO|nr:5'-nucleotidase C-terminal domain-containing protein [Actinomyces slackii]VEG74260.1 Endonuclease YhcR precursor [Actinomyces slackii]